MIRRYTPVLFSLMFLGACGGEPVVDPLCGGNLDFCYTPWPGAAPTPQPPRCQVSMCLTGAIDTSSGSNAHFQNICEHEPIPGLLRDCDGASCRTSFSSFTLTRSDALYRTMFDALDTNADGFIDESDERCDLNLLGFSWGGFTAVELAARLERDARVASERARVSKLLLLDPYRPGGDLRIPRNADLTRVWRQSGSSESDCSRVAPGGPYQGARPVCPEGADCVDVDLSSLEETFVSSDLTWSLDPWEVGHCRVPLVARDRVMEVLFGL